MIYPHTVTVWARNEEGRHVEWTAPEILTRVRFEESFGQSPSPDGSVSNRSAILIMPGSSEPLHAGDRVVSGAHTEDTPPQDAFTVEAAVPISIKQSVHHWELTLK